MLFDTNKELHKYFKEISNIPRKSGNELAISDYLLEFAKTHQLEASRDALYNVIIKKPGTGALASHDPVIFQGHTDMVCEKEPESNHDFTKDPIELVEKDGWLYANKTTLGADNGVAVAYMLTLLSDSKIVHPPLECLFTVQEETGLFGAKAVNMNDFLGTRLINLDCGPEGVTTISCAGGCRLYMKFNHEYQANPFSTYRLTIGNLKGGHSGMDIHKPRLNANRVLFGLLQEAVNQNIELNLISGKGGMQDNAIPRDAYMDLAINKDHLESLNTLINAHLENVRQYEVNGTITLEEIDPVKDVISTDDTLRYIKVFNELPNGVQKMSTTFEGLVEASMNLGVYTLNSVFEIDSSIRSTNETSLDQLIEKAQAITKQYQGEGETAGRYPGWDFNPNSKLRDIFCETYKEMYGKDATLVPIHAGLECGFFSHGKPELDIIAIGPDAEMIHTPKERLNIASFDRIYDSLVEILKKL